MNNLYDEILYLSGLTAQGCWEELDTYTQQAIYEFGKLIVQECAKICMDNLAQRTINNDLSYNDGVMDCSIMIKKHFGDQNAE